MNPVTVGILGWVTLFVLLFAGIPIAVAMSVVGFLGVSYLVSAEAGLALIALETFQNLNSYNLSVIPLFVLMGAFAFVSGLGRDFYQATYKWIGHVPGGLAIATVGACAGFAAVCGSSPATAATMGAVALPEMKRFHFHPSLATGAVAAGGTLGILIPPSVIFIIYGIMTEQSIGKLFLAGIFPGIILTLLFMATIYIQTRLNPAIGPRGPKSNFKERLTASGGFLGMAAIFALIMCGFLIGWFTPTEAGAVGAFGVLALNLCRKKFTRKTLANALFDTMQTTAMIFFIIVGAMIFARFLALTRIPFLLSNYLGGLSVNPTVVMLFILAMYLILGCIMDSLAMMIITVPIIYPIIVTLGFDPIWFGVIIVLVIEAGLITPPIGLNVYIIKGVAKDEVSLVQVWQGIMPFLGAILILLMMLLIFPQLALFLPGLIK